MESLPKQRSPAGRGTGANKHPVGGPTAFAITLEQAGGVVVSDGPMLLVASVGS